AGDVGAGLDQNSADRLTVGIGLVGHQPLAEPLLGKGADIVGGVHQLDTAGLAAAASMHLGLDHPAVATNGGSGGDRLGHGFGRHTLRDRQAVFGKQLFALVLMQIHSGFPLLEAVVVELVVVELVVVELVVVEFVVAWTSVPGLEAGAL